MRDSSDKPAIAARLISQFFTVLWVCTLAGAAPPGVIHSGDLTVFFEAPLRVQAEEVGDLYPDVKAELEEAFSLRLDFRPTVLLVNSREKFVMMARSERVLAFAIPEKEFIAIDYSRIGVRPFTLRGTLKHELAHLLLHHHIGSSNLPKWLDEGLCQWVSGGVTEILFEEKRSALKAATLSRRTIPMRALSESFPGKWERLQLAYEQSRSFVEYMVDEFGRDGMVDVLAYLADGATADAAILNAFSIPLDELERKWKDHLRIKTTWIRFVLQNLYPILFFIAALITIVGFIRVVMKKRRYRDESEV